MKAKTKIGMGMKLEDYNEKKITKKTDTTNGDYEAADYLFCQC